MDSSAGNDDIGSVVIAEKEPIDLGRRDPGPEDHTDTIRGKIDGAAAPSKAVLAATDQQAAIQERVGSAPDPGTETNLRWQGKLWGSIAPIDRGCVRPAEQSRDPKSQASDAPPCDRLSRGGSTRALIFRSSAWGTGRGRVGRGKPDLPSVWVSNLQIFAGGSATRSTQPAQQEQGADACSCGTGARNSWRAPPLFRLCGLFGPGDLLIRLDQPG
jgi:hypothetical protein